MQPPRCQHLPLTLIVKVLLPPKELLRAPAQLLRPGRPPTEIAVEVPVEHRVAVDARVQPARLRLGVVAETAVGVAPIQLLLENVDELHGEAVLVGDARQGGGGGVVKVVAAAGVHLHDVVDGGEGGGTGGAARPPRAAVDDVEQRTL